MNTDQENEEIEKKIRDLWKDATRYHETRKEILHAISSIAPEPKSVPIYRQRFFTIAASVLVLIGIAAVILFMIKRSPEGSRNDMFTKETDSAHQLRMDKPESKARLQVYTKEISLQWNVVYDTTAHLFIVNLANGKVAFKAAIKPKQTSISLNAGTLQSGEYEWFVGDKKNKKRLTIGKID